MPREQIEASAGESRKQVRAARGFTFKLSAILLFVDVDRIKVITYTLLGVCVGVATLL